MAGPRYDHRRRRRLRTHLGRVHLLKNEIEQCAQYLHRAQRFTQEAGWLAFASSPLSWLAQVEMHEGLIEEAAELFNHAHALALEVNDPCWESLALRGLGLVAAERGDHRAAARLLHDSRAACRRINDSYVWLEAYGLAAQASHAVTDGLQRSEELIDDLDRLASAHGIRELQAEAAMLRVRAGRIDALEAARSHVDAVDNPVLTARLRHLEPEPTR